MKRTGRMLIGAGCVLLLIISWAVAVNAKSTEKKQLELMIRAKELTDDGVFIRAVPLLEEAAGYNAELTAEAESELKKVYLALINQSGFRRKYTELLEKQMKRADAPPELFAEAANYYLGISKTSDALVILKNGIERTGSGDLTDLYENNRYAYEMSRTSYEYVAAIFGTTVQVRTDGLWGLARSDGILLIPCQYDKISTFSLDRAIVQKDNEIFAVDSNNNRLALLHEDADAFGNFADNRIPLLLDGGWRRATGEFTIGTAEFQQLGMYSGGYAAAKINGKWGVVDLESNWLIPAEYDEIVLDELGRCYDRGVVFARKNGVVYLLAGGARTGERFDDARPFAEDGYAAVMKNGKWGFIDADGTVVIDFIYDDALSFGQHLAAVRIGELWGYISKQGKTVIEPAFIEAKSFSNGNAPVLTQLGWQFITLVEYKRGVSL